MNENGKIERSELFESKFVKNILETYNNIIEIMEQQDNEIHAYIRDNKPKQQKIEEPDSLKMLKEKLSIAEVDIKEPDKPLSVNVTPNVAMFENYID